MNKEIRAFLMTLSILLMIFGSFLVYHGIFGIEEKPQEAYEIEFITLDDMQNDNIEILEKRIKALEDKPEITKYKQIEDTIASIKGTIFEWDKYQERFESTMYICNDNFIDCGGETEVYSSNYNKSEILNKEFFKPIK